jgi:uncharacterized RDD family membrane protein YckC
VQPPPPTPPEDDLEPTVAMPRVEAPPPGAPAEVHGTPAVPVAPPVSATVAPPPVTPTVLPPQPPPRPSTAPDRPQYVFGNPFAYVVARFAAFVLDVVMIALVVSALAYSLIAINPLNGLPTTSESGLDATLGLGVVIALVYVWISEALLGTTIWKLAFGLHVYAPGKRFVGLGRAFVRNLLRPVDALVIGGILALLPGHRRLGDLLGGTLVARSPLRAFAPLVGWILIILLCGMPFVIGGVERTMASLVALIVFVPALFVKFWVLIQTLFGLPH